MNKFKTLFIVALLMLAVFFIGRQTSTAIGDNSEVLDNYELHATSSYVSSFRTLKGVDVEVYSHSGNYIYIAKYKDSISISSK